MINTGDLQLLQFPHQEQQIHHIRIRSCTKNHSKLEPRGEWPLWKQLSKMEYSEIAGEEWQGSHLYCIQSVIHKSRFVCQMQTLVFAACRESQKNIFNNADDLREIRNNTAETWTCLQSVTLHKQPINTPNTDCIMSDLFCTKLSHLLQTKLSTMTSSKLDTMVGSMYSWRTRMPLLIYVVLLSLEWAHHTGKDTYQAIIREIIQALSILSWVCPSGTSLPERHILLCSSIQVHSIHLLGHFILFSFLYIHWWQ